MLVGLAGLLATTCACCCIPPLDTPSASHTTVQPDGTHVVTLDITDVNASLMERNSTWSKYAYTITVMNHGDRTLHRAMLVEFIDSDGMLIDSDRVYDAVLYPGENQVRGDVLISANNHRRDDVARVSAKFR